MVLGADPVTLARRWQRMTGEGTAYVTAVESAADDLVIAFLELDCPPGAVDGVIRQLAHDPAVTTIDRTSGSRTLMATVFAETVSALGEWTASTSAALGAVSGLHSHLVTELVADARAWRLRALSGAEADRVAALAPAVPAAPQLTPRARARLVAALSRDVRAPASALAEASGMSPRAVASAVGWLLGSGEVAVRIDVARVLTAWPVYVWYFLRTPAATSERVVQRLRRLPEMRVVARTVGRSNIVMAVWLQSLSEVRRFEAELHDKLPDVQIEDEAAVLRTEKHVGHLLDARGFATGAVVPFVPAAGPG